MVAHTIPTDELIEIRDSIANGFGEDVAQEVVVRMLEKPDNGRADNDWRSFGFTIARRLVIDQHRYAAWQRSLCVRLVERGNLTETTPKSFIECQVIAREQLRRVGKVKYAVRVVLYSIGQNQTDSRQRIDQIRRKMREELE